MLCSGYYLGFVQGYMPTRDDFLAVIAEMDKSMTIYQIAWKMALNVLIVVGDLNFYFPIDSFDEMYERIPQATLKIFHGKGHDVFEDPNAMRYIAEYLLESRP